MEERGICLIAMQLHKTSERCNLIASNKSIVEKMKKIQGDDDAMSLKKRVCVLIHHVVFCSTHYNIMGYLTEFIVTYKKVWKHCS